MNKYKIGDKVWYINNKSIYSECSSCGIRQHKGYETVTKSCKIVSIHANTYKNENSDFTSIKYGINNPDYMSIMEESKLFATKEEAEAKLKGDK